jgi:hypothetical protein
MVLGNNAISTDSITLKLLNLKTQNHDLILNAHKRGLGPIDSNIINSLGEDPEGNTISVEFCKEKLEDINLRNCTINSGRMCSGCFLNAYHLLNIMKTQMVKDLKYNPGNAFLIGLNPNGPERFKNIILFGDCAIKSTKNGKFRKIRMTSKKSSKKKKISKKSREKNKQKKEIIKFKTNKSILELPGCPPNIFTCLELIYKYYGKKNVPNLFLLRNFLKTLINSKTTESLRIMGVI